MAPFATRALFTTKRPATKVQEKPAPAKKAGFNLFSAKKAAPVPKVEPAPAKTGFTLFGAKKAAPVPKVEPAPVKKTGFTLFGAKKATAAPTGKVDKAAEYRKQESALSAMDFSRARSNKDAELLYDAKYGKLEGGKMSKEQYAALRRKIGGTAKDFWKTSIDVQGEYTDKGYVAKDQGTNVPALPFLVGTVLSLFGALGYVVTQTTQ
jgi:hypothetical protein